MTSPCACTYACNVNICLFLVALLVSGSDIQYMRNALETYFGDIRHHDIDPEYKKASKEFIYNEFMRFGLDTEYSDFRAPEFSQTVCVCLHVKQVFVCLIYTVIV